MANRQEQAGDHDDNGSGGLHRRKGPGDEVPGTLAHDPTGGEVGGRQLQTSRIHQGKPTKMTVDGERFIGQYRAPTGLNGPVGGFADTG
jgi:hypothetical protein